MLSTPIRTCLAGILFALCVHAQPRRIVSTFPSITETLFALGAGDRVVGVSDYCTYPPAVLALPRVGSYIKPDAEKIALLRPDLVILQKAASSLDERLSALKIPQLDVTIGSLPDVFTMIRQIGTAAGVADRAEKLNRDIQSKLDGFRAEVSSREAKGKPRPTVLIIVGRTPGLLTNLIGVSVGSYLGELLEIAGGRNVLANPAPAYPHISMETVVRLNPDFILDASFMGEHAEHLREPWMAHPELAAVQKGQVFGLPSEPILTPGPRVIESVEILRSKILR
jgi:iron complex transport system substrate-binding protein